LESVSSSRTIRITYGQQLHQITFDDISSDAGSQICPGARTVGSLVNGAARAAHPVEDGHSDVVSSTQNGIGVLTCTVDLGKVEAERHRPVIVETLLPGNLDGRRHLRPVHDRGRLRFIRIDPLKLRIGGSRLH